jgi:hypothetical protein
MLARVLALNLPRSLARTPWRCQLHMRHELCLPTLLFLLEALAFRAKFAVEPVAATSVARVARAASFKHQGQHEERDREQAQQEEEETASKSSELRQASTTRSHQADDSDEDDGENDGDNDGDNDTPTSSADLLSRARHIVGSYIDTAEAGILLSDSTRAGLQLLSTRSSYVQVVWPSRARSMHSSSVVSSRTQLTPLHADAQRWRCSR